MLVVKYCPVTLHICTLDGGDARDLMDDKQHHPPQIFWDASWIINLEVRADSEPMLVKPVGRINHVCLSIVVNERAVAPFV